MKKTDRNKKSLPRRSKAERLRSDTLRAMLLPPILCAALCLVCLCGLSWAWFTVGVSAGTSSVSGAQYSVSATVTNGETPVAPENGGFALSANTEYTVTLTAEGSASTGFCVITLTGGTTQTLTTAQIAHGETLGFKLIPQEDTTLTAVAHWGVNSAEAPLQNGTKIGELVTVPADEKTPEDAVSPSETTEIPAPSASPSPSAEPSTAPSAAPSSAPSVTPTDESTEPSASATPSPSPAASESGATESTEQASDGSEAAETSEQ